jgi:large subunit ribosomal protein L1
VTQPGKRYRTAVKEIVPDQSYPAREALALVKQLANAKFPETVEVAIRLGVDAKKGEQMVRGTLALPHGTGKTTRVAAIAAGENAAAARDAGADEVGAEDLIQRIDQGWREFDVLIATRDMMRLLGPLGKKLGPRMPNPKAGTLTDDIGRTVRELKGGRVEFRMDKAGIIHMPVGKASFEVAQLEENLAALIAAVSRAKPSGSKGQFLRKITLSSTMGPGILVDPSDVVALAEG